MLLIYQLFVVVTFIEHCLKQFEIFKKQASTINIVKLNYINVYKKLFKSELSTLLNNT